MHWNNRDDPSELEVDQIPAEYVDLELDAEFDNYGILIRSVWVVPIIWDMVGLVRPLLEQPSGMSA